jgi:hypothetical protein
MPGRPCNAKGGLGNVEGSSGVPGSERLARPRTRQGGQVQRVNFLRSFESSFEQLDGGFEFPVERMSMP